jgi:drug/metabolite transporter (DMT)-like permease
VSPAVDRRGDPADRRATDRRATDRRGELIGSGLCALMAILFAFVVIFGKQVQEGRLPFTFLSIRFAGQSVLLMGLIVVLGRPLVPEHGERLALALAGTVGYGSESAFYFTALNHGSAATVTLLFYTYPVWVMLVTMTLDRKAPPAALFGALGLALAGSAMVVLGGGGGDIETTGIVLAICTSLAYSAYLIGTDRTVKRTDPLAAAAWLGAGAAVANVVYAMAFGAVVVPSAGSWWRLAAMAVFSAGAFAAMLAGLQLVGAVRNAIIGVMEPLTVAILAAAFLNEPLTIPVVVGGTLILGGAVIASLIRTTRTAEPNV